MALALDRMTRALFDAQEGEPSPCRGCIACNLRSTDPRSLETAALLP